MSQANHQRLRRFWLAFLPAAARAQGGIFGGMGFGNLGFGGGAAPTAPQQGATGGGGSPFGMGFGGGAAPNGQQQPAGGAFGMGGGLPPLGGASGLPPMGAGGLPPMGGGLPPMPGMQGTQQQQVPQQGQRQQMGDAPAEIPHDMGCSEGPRQAVWQQAKRRFREVFGEPQGAADSQSPFEVASREVVDAALQGAIKELTAQGALTAETQAECGFGKLFLQLASVANMEDAAGLSEVFQGIEPITSPVLTLLLDIPWVGTAQAGWPLFGLFSHVSLRKQRAGAGMNDAATDGLDDAGSQELFRVYQAAAQALDIGTMAQASAAFLENPSRGGGALAVFTAMASQAAVAPLEQRLEALQVIQQAFKRAVQDAAGFDVLLSTNWPLWTMLHLAVTPLTVSGAE